MNFTGYMMEQSAPMWLGGTEVEATVGAWGQGLWRRLRVSFELLVHFLIDFIGDKVSLWVWDLWYLPWGFMTDSFLLMYSLSVLELWCSPIHLHFFIILRKILQLDSSVYFNIYFPFQKLFLSSHTEALSFLSHYFYFCSFSPVFWV